MSVSRLLSPSYDMAAALQTSLARANYEKDFASRWSICQCCINVDNIGYLRNWYWISVKSILDFCSMSIGFLWHQDWQHWQGAWRHGGNNSLRSRLNSRFWPCCHCCGGVLWHHKVFRKVFSFFLTCWPPLLTPQDWVDNLWAFNNIDDEFDVFNL